MTREWRPGAPVPARFSGMPVTIRWNDVALGCLLRAIKREYEPGYAPMCEAIQEAVRTFTPPKPDEPTDPAVRIASRSALWARVGEVWIANGFCALTWEQLIAANWEQVTP